MCGSFTFPKRYKNVLSKLDNNGKVERYYNKNRCTLTICACRFFSHVNLGNFQLISLGTFLKYAFTTPSRNTSVFHLTRLYLTPSYKIEDNQKSKMLNTKCFHA